MLHKSGWTKYDTVFICFLSSVFVWSATGQNTEHSLVLKNMEMKFADFSCNRKLNGSVYVSKM